MIAMNWKRSLILLGIWLLCQFANLIAALWMLAAIATGSQRAWTLAVSYDQLGNAVTGGDPDETISSAAYKKSLKGVKWAKWLCKALETIDPGHCKRAVEWDEGIKRRTL